nr:Xaa-Pro peptidase family protein [Texcoconibacillus texcoconensis]
MQQWMKEVNVDVTCLQSKANVFYFSDFYTDPHERLVALFLFQDETQIPLMVCPSMEVNQARDTGFKGEVIGYHDHEDPWQLVKKAIESRGIGVKKVGVEKQEMSLARAEQLSEVFAGVDIVRADEQVHALRKVKSENEIDALRKAAKLADYGVQIGIESLELGKTEVEVLADIEAALKKKNVVGMSFSTMVLFGEKTSDPHGNPGNRRLQRGDFVLFDLGVIIDGYCSDITRTVVYGEANEKQREVYETVLRAQNETLARCQAGTQIGELDKTARKLIEGAGYGQYFPHRIGHGLGIDVHEAPSMHEHNKETLVDGMAFTIEPGIYHPEIGGVRIEDDVVIENGNAVCLTNFPKELQIINESD